MVNEFENMEISQITIISGSGIAIYDCGPDQEIKKFEDHSLEYEDDIHIEYWGYNKDNKVIKVIQNCPVDITYKEKVNND